MIAPRRVGSTALALSAGQRAEVLVEGGEEDVTLALDLFEDVVELGYLVRAGDPGSATMPENFALPDNPIARDVDSAKARRIPLVIEGGAKGGLVDDIGFAQRDPHCTSHQRSVGDPLQTRSGR